MSQSQFKTILCVDDDPTIRSFCNSILKKAGYEVVSVENGEEAIGHLIKFGEVDLIITDIEMPIMNGFELLKKVSLFKPHLPTIVLTKFSDTSNIEKAWRNKAFDLIEKPVERESLIAAVDLALKHKKSWDQPMTIGDSMIKYRSFKQKHLIFNKNKLFDTLDNDSETIQEVLKSFLLSSTLIVDDLVRNFDPENNYRSFKKPLHKLIGSSETIRAEVTSYYSQSIMESILTGEVVNRSDLGKLICTIKELQTEIKQVLNQLNNDDSFLSNEKLSKEND